MKAARRWAAALTAILGSSAGSSISAQVAATLAMSASLVEYEGFLASGAGTLSPGLRFESSSLSLGAQGGLTIFESGNRVLQATTAASWLATVHPRWRLELSGLIGASRYAAEPASAHVLGGGRMHLVSSDAGGWAGASTGTVSTVSGAPLELEAGVWAVHDRFTVVGTLTAAWLGEDNHVDLLGALRWTSGIVEVETRLNARPWTRSNERIGDAVPGVFGEVSALVSLGPRIALTVAGGSYPADPVRRALAARYLTAGIRLSTPARRPEPPPRLTGAALADVRDRLARSGSANEAPALEVAGAGQQRTLRISAPGASTVELMADFTDWEPVAFTRGRDGLWELQLTVAPGVHRLNVRIDGGAWFVPSGARAEPGEYGGAVGIIIVR